jgi:hypothetical protein
VNVILIKAGTDCVSPLSYLFSNPKSTPWQGIVGKDGIFPISAPLAKAVREAKSSAVKIITPRKWEATINAEAVRNLSVIYQ